ncbi:glycoside hydrolase family 88 protein [Thelephora ganbajun]|uniref:Glycoside hydrolase family 88 protein n=1 Tax=Thelephora ganbajun TaxID=370292 RepID=A0ACB6ZLZ9_THEGA|nr:glycoside hydrolase family 88 protein [Thelephora ganbajun]
MRSFAPLLALVFIPCALPVSWAAQPPKELYSRLVSSKILATARDRRDGKSYPHNTDQVNGIWNYVGTDWWTSGFFPSTLYSMNRRSELCPTTVDKVDWVNLGQVWSADLTRLLIRNSVGHDIGFISFPFVDELTIHPNNETTAEIIEGFSDILAKRFDRTVGCTRSRDSSGTNFQVIIDNMMTLDLFFVASRLTGNKTLIDMAISHADKTIEHHIRPDGSSYHVVEYDSSTGRVIRRRTAQGYADESTWTRGQAWGMLGFTNMYRRTELERYLQTARRMSKLFISRMPPSGVVPWDFDAPIDPPRPADVSAANLAAYALLTLSEQESGINNSTGAKYYADAAVKLLADTVNLAWRPSWRSLFSNGTINKPSDDYWTGIVYADYYLVESGNKLLEMGLGGCSL